MGYYIFGGEKYFGKSGFYVGYKKIFNFYLKK